MRVAPAVAPNPQKSEALEQRSRGRSLPARIVERARIVLLAAEGRQNKEIAGRLGVSVQKAARWRARFLERGLAGLDRDAPRPGRTPKIDAAAVARVVRMTTQQKQPNATHWSTRTMAQAAGISPASVGRIWRQHGLKPHRVETFKLSRDPQFAEKLQTIVGLYLNPPEHALGVCCDEKSRIRALDGTQPSLLLKRGRAGTTTHDDKRDDVATPFAALNSLDGTVTSLCMERHRHQE